MKKLQLTRKREAWAATRSAPTVFKGEKLMPNMGAQAKYVHALTSLTAQMTAQVKREIVKLFKTDAAAAHFGQDATIASQSRILIADLGARFNDLFAKKAKPLAETMVKDADKVSTTTMHSSLQKLSGGMSLKTSAWSSGLENIYKASVAENVSLIKSIASEYLQKVEGAVMRSITTGNGLQDLIPALEQYEGMTHRRAKNIALDQTRKAYNSINKGRMQALGVSKFMWHHSGGGAHPREDHIEMDGQIYSFDNLPVIDERTGERGIPGQAPNCFPSESNVEFPNGADKLFRRFYTGELLALVTDDGEVLEATRNHPVLTNRGWLPLDQVCEGDYLVSNGEQSAWVGEADVNGRISSFGEVFDSALGLLSERTARSAGAAFQFHGDGSDQEVDIVFTNCKLPPEADARFCQVLSELILAFADIDCAVNVHSGQRTANEFVAVAFNTSDGHICRLSALLALLKSSGLGANETRLRLAAYLHARFYEAQPDGVAGDVEIFGKLKLAQTSQIASNDSIIGEILAACRLSGRQGQHEVASAQKLGEVVGVDFEKFCNLSESAGSVKKFHRVVEKRFRKFSGHVHNAETPGSWYVVNGFIVHNCRCVMSPVFSFDKE